MKREVQKVIKRRGSRHPIAFGEGSLGRRFTSGLGSPRIYAWGISDTDSSISEADHNAPNQRQKPIRGLHFQPNPFAGLVGAHALHPSFMRFV